MIYAKNENGTIKTYGKLPKKFNNILNFQNASEQVHQEHGFYPLVDVEITTTQKKGNLYFDEDNNVFTYEIIDKTQAEIDAEIEAQELSEIENDIQIGIDASNRLKRYLKNNLTAPQFKTAKRLVYPVWSLLRFGDFDTAYDEMEAINVSRALQPMKNLILLKISELGGAKSMKEKMSSSNAVPSDNVKKRCKLLVFFDKLFKKK